MNKDFILEILNSFEYVENGQVAYSKFLSDIKKEGIDMTILNNLVSLQLTSYQRAENFFRLKKGMAKLHNILPPEKYEQLITAIERERMLSVMLNKSCIEYTKTQNKRYLETIYNILNAEDKYVRNLNQAFSMVEDQFGILLVSSALNNQTSLEDIRQLAVSLKPGSNIQKNMEQLTRTLERRNQNLGGKEQPGVSKEQDSIKGDESTLQEKLDQIHYSLDGNLVTEVQELTVEERIHQIDISIAELASKQKASLKDMIALQVLERERLELEAYVASLGDKKLSRSQTKREKMMRVATIKLEENKNQLEKSKENYERYRGKFVRFFSARYQRKLEEKISKLQKKRGTIQEKQKLSAIAKFDKKARKMVRKSHVLGFGKAVNQYKNDRLADLKSFRNQIVEEFRSLRNDYVRFKSSKKDVESLKNKNGVILSPMVSIEEHSIEQQSKRVA